MFEELKSTWITEEYMSYKAILVPSMKKQLSTSGLMLDLDSLPVKPFPFKELFIRWLIYINKDRIKDNLPIMINQQIISMCPIWRLIKCPLKKIQLTKENMFNKPTPSIGSIGSMGPVPPMGTINKNAPKSKPGNIK